MFRRRNVSVHAFSRIFTTDLVANDCRVFDWLGALIKKTKGDAIEEPAVY